MKIGEIAKLVGLTPKSIRFYEATQLLDAPFRQKNGYRQYTQAHLQTLKLIKRARDVGFSLEECRTLISLWRSPCRKSEDVNKTILQKIELITQQINLLTEVKATLTKLSDQCPNNQQSTCPILSELLK
ncbi:MerR family transcriptional regulator [Thorsellia anophelis]|uniref:HTH-type transcriptional regulator CueR n=1 Tax=Thorsellia anophelis DSM 18579 TaxID=1123402 RepID=A0A1I0AB40_9GAMM|nr:MerR family transcriptional regulator [Thorsellia anophelis]SES91428.1 MerR family transcriptional regulator, copper efflux regulator [Thorsellia anophelis DSM 18579]